MTGKSLIFFITVTITFLGLQTTASSRHNSDHQTIIAAIPRNFPPHYTIDEHGKPKGFAIDIMEQISLLADFDVKYLVKENWQDVARALETREADAIPNLGIIPEREEVFSFTAPIETFNLRIFIRKDTNSIYGLEDLQRGGAKIAVVQYNAGANFVEKNILPDLVQIYDSSENALVALISGEVDALIYPEPVLMKMARASAIHDQIKAVGRPLQEIKRGLAVHKNNPLLLRKLNGAVQQLVYSPAYQKIYADWYGTPPPFWDTANVLWAMGIVALVVLTASGAWRYRSVTLLNRELNKTMAKKEKAEQKLQQAMYVLENATEAFFWVQLTGRIFYSNKRTSTNLLYSKKELAELNFWDINQDYPQSRWAEFINQVKPDDLQEIKSVHRRKDGTVFPVIIQPRLLTFDGNSFICLMVQDISKREAAEKALQASEECLRTIVENVPDAIVTITEQGLIRSFNPAAENIFGHQAATVIGKNVSMLMPQPYRESHDSYMKNYLESGRARLIGYGSREALGINCNGENFPIDISVNEMKQDGQRFFVGVIRDISERKRSEQKIISQKAELAAVHQAESLKSSFLATVSHELRTPLTPIIGFAERISQKATDPDGKTKIYADHILQNAKFLLELINDLLDFSKIEAGKIDLQLKQTEMETVLDELRSSIHHLLEAKKLAFEINIAPDLPPVLLDSLRIKQIFFNLISNAVKFTPPQGKITVSAESTKNEIIIAVKDTGEGIPKECLTKIFDYFYQVGRKQQEQQGTGLGLAITQKLVEIHGGKIWVESELNKGSIFYFTIPTMKNNEVLYEI
ncbi:MAG: PAS domain S-box protein [Desulfobulbaceae bacterium]|nr:PAS domain S-box protein [Desulfobulbaceae bacterium]HIJ78744.1 PAS domain S-box protein [Deltaproteobacteria bacterium]